MPGKPSKADWAEEKIMPSIEERIVMDALVVIELRNLMKWIKRELRIYKNDPELQKQVAENLSKVTTLPLEELTRGMNNGY